MDLRSAVEAGWEHQVELRADRRQPARPDEWVDLESVKDTTLVLALAAEAWCGA